MQQAKKEKKMVQKLKYWAPTWLKSCGVNTYAT